MDVESIIIGGFAFVQIVAALLTAPLSLFLLYLYRRAVLRGMNVSADTTDTAIGQQGEDSKPPSQDLRIINVNPTERASKAGDRARLNRPLARSLWRLGLTYTLAGLAFAALFAVTWQIESEDGFLPIRSLMLTATFAWPLVLTFSLMFALGWKERLGFIVIYSIILLVLALLSLPRSAGLNLFDLVLLWLMMNGLATLLLATFLTRRIRAVGPLVLVFMTAGVAGAVWLPLVIANSNNVLWGFSGVMKLFGLGGTAGYIVLNLFGFLVLALIGWFLLRLLGRRYRQKRLSEQSLMIDAVWLQFAMAYALLLAPGGLAWLLAGPAAFLLYKLVLWVGFAQFVRPPTGASQPPTLLLLRVFSLGPRSLRLFDALSKRWLRAGSISLIAGPDLVTGIVEPHEFLDFLGGQLSRQFVEGREDLARRLAGLDTQADPDGRYRVNEFFCRADTWQITMQQLSTRSDAVLMDVRSFSPSNQGVRFELGQLLNIVPLERILLIVDGTTEGDFLADTLQELWRGVPIDSPNRVLADPEIRLFDVTSGTEAEVRTLLNLLFAQPDVLASFESASQAETISS